jgi:hypothetical protein
MLGASANPSVSFANACAISAIGVEGQKSAIFFYSLAPSAQQWGAGPSFLCVKAPTARTLTQPTGGTSAACDGALGLAWNAFQLANPNALGTPWTAGEQVFVQLWFRDPPASKATSLSDAVRMTYVP